MLCRSLLTRTMWEPAALRASFEAIRRNFPKYHSHFRFPLIFTKRALHHPSTPLPSSFLLHSHLDRCGRKQIRRRKTTTSKLLPKKKSHFRTFIFATANKLIMQGAGILLILTVGSNFIWAAAKRVVNCNPAASLWNKQKSDVTFPFVTDWKKPGLLKASWQLCQALFSRTALSGL